MNVGSGVLLFLFDLYGRAIEDTFATTPSVAYIGIVRSMAAYLMIKLLCPMISYVSVWRPHLASAPHSSPVRHGEVNFCLQSQTAPDYRLCYLR